jgi:hypothetical protein
MTEVALAEHNNVVKALRSDRTDQPFGIYVGRSRMPIIEVF